MKVCPKCRKPVEFTEAQLKQRFIKCQCGVNLVTPEGEKWLQWRDELIANYKTKKENENGRKEV